MTTKLTSITTQYRSFVNDQVLTAAQLNDLVQYFEDQARLSRICLNGVGIVCGFHVSINSSKEIIVTQGCGITTDGDLIQLRKTIEGDSALNIDIHSIKYTQYRLFEDSNATYEPFLKANSQISLFELIPDFQTLNSNNQSITSLSGVEDMIAIIYLEEFSKSPELCTAIDCNNQGIEEISRLKVLLVSEDDAKYIISSDPIYSKHSILSAYLLLPDIAVPRVLLNNISAASQTNLQKSFYSAISSNNIISQLKTGITILFNQFSGFLNISTDITDVIINQLIDQHLGFSASAIPTDVQYRFDLLKDLVDTYNEIKELLLQLESECCPDIQSFPKHLMIGKLTVSENSEPFRHSFYKSPVSGNGQQNILRLNSLITRFFLMLSRYGISGTEVKVTPSKTKVSLSNRSIPYYFNINDDIIENWDFTRTKRLMQKNNLCYFTTNLSPTNHVQNPLKFNIEAFDFFRIEGQLGSPSETVETQLNTLRTSNGLDFDYFSFDIDKDQTELQQFISKNNALEHFAGVTKGGTFILLNKANLVIADFAMSHKYMVTTATDFCCKISECSYPWISSLNYLNNLSRSLKGTQSRTKLMPKSFKLLITTYSINSIPLINHPVEIDIPLTEVFMRRVHIITEKLNERFPTGLVFDFDQVNKQLKIKKIMDDTFVFCVKDVTLSNNTPVYTYTECGFLRNSKMFRAKDIVCTEVNIHHKSIYQQLHEKYNPQNKDDDYGRYNEKWKKWNSLVDKLVTNPFFVDKKEKRFVTNFRELPSSIQEELKPIKADIVKVNTNAKVYLSGDWVDGTWVDNEMINYYNANQKNTHDDIVLFVKLRENLHQKSGKSRFVIFVSTLTDGQIKTLQIKYMNKVDFYLGKAEGEKFIEII